MLVGTGDWVRELAALRGAAQGWRCRHHLRRHLPRRCRKDAEPLAGHWA